MLKLSQVIGDEYNNFCGKIVALTLDGSIAIISPVSGQILSMVYPSLDNYVSLKICLHEKQKGFL